MAGVGKTTFVENIYQCPEIIQEFPRRAWADVLHPFVPDEFIRGIALQLQDRPVNRDMPTIIDTVRGLSTQSYSTVRTEELLGNITQKHLIVVDGLSSEGEWDMIKASLVNVTSGSRIIVTTREASVAGHCSLPQGNHIDLQGLKYLDAFKLFKTKVSASSSSVPCFELISMAQ
jgi:hypothetical protein